MGLTLKNLSGFQAGVEVDEVGINIASVSTRYFPEFKRKLPNKDGQTRGWAIPDVPSAEMTIRGEVSGPTGLLALTFATAYAPTNDSALFGRNAGDFYADEMTESQEREGWRTLDAKLTADPLVEDP